MRIIGLLVGILTLIIALGVFYFAFFSDAETQLGNDIGEMTKENINEGEDIISTTKCMELGCPSDTIYVGSINSDKYYGCDCRYVKTVLPENIACFDSDQDALDQGYTKSDC